MTKISDQIKSIVIIPGSGEFVYDTELVVKSGTSLNGHLGDSISHARATVDTLLSTFPNLKNVSVVIGWFADSIEAGKMTISPRVEHSVLHKNDQWKVGNYVRNNTKVTKNWGGTPSDKSVVNLVKALTDKGLEVTIYPMLYVDDPDKSWRGDIDAKNNKGVDNFFAQYNKFIMHYATLKYQDVKLKDLAKNFIIGSEMVKLLQYDEGNNKYYAVKKMTELAMQIKHTLGQEVSTIYAANWGEYGRHPKTGYYYLDKLYNKIDKVGINAYFRLTDDLSQDQITPDVIKSGWESGIDYDYWVDGNNTKKVINDLSYAAKALKPWFLSKHINPNGHATSWVPGDQPGAKEVLATEIGYASVDCTTNDPGKFYSPGTKGSGLPPHSLGAIDYSAQTDAISSAIAYWDEVHSKDTSHQYDKLFNQLDWYCYDIRGNLDEFSDEFSDASDYLYGHWIKLEDNFVA